MLFVHQAAKALTHIIAETSEAFPVAHCLVASKPLGTLFQKNPQGATGRCAGIGHVDSRFALQVVCLLAFQRFLEVGWGEGSWDLEDRWLSQVTSWTLKRAVRLQSYLWHRPHSAFKFTIFICTWDILRSLHFYHLIAIYCNLLSMKHVCSLGDCIWAFRGTWSDRPDQGPHCAGGMTRTGWSIKVSANPVATDLMIKGTSPQEKKHIKVHRNYPWVSFLIFWGSAIALPSFAFKLNHWRSGNIGNMPPAAVPVTFGAMSQWPLQVGTGEGKSMIVAAGGLICWGPSNSSMLLGLVPSRSLQLIWWRPQQYIAIIACQRIDGRMFLRRCHLHCIYI